MINSSSNYFALLLLLALTLLFDFFADAFRVDRNRISHIVNLVHANKPLCPVKHVVTQRNDEELAVLRPLGDVLRDDGHVAVVERRVNLVHAIQRARLVEVQSEYEAERAERLLTAGQLTHVLPRFFEGPNLEEDALGERVESVLDFELSVSAVRDEPIHRLEVVRDELEAIHEVFEPALLQPCMLLLLQCDGRFRLLELLALRAIVG